MILYREITFGEIRIIWKIGFFFLPLHFVSGGQSNQHSYRDRLSLLSIVVPKKTSIMAEETPVEITEEDMAKYTPSTPHNHALRPCMRDPRVLLHCIT